MKVIVAGASGFVGTELVRQCLNNPNVSSVIALARKSVKPPKGLNPNADVSKLESVTIENYGTYQGEIKKHFASADGCIWTVAITPSKSEAYDFAEVRRVCQDHPLAALKSICEARLGRAESVKPFRFIYMSGIAAERDPTKIPKWKPEYSLMRGETENRILAFAHDNEGNLEACVAKPGLISTPGMNLRHITSTALLYTVGVPNVALSECAAAMLDQIANGFEKEPLQHDDLVTIGRRAISGSLSMPK